MLGSVGDEPRFWLLLARSGDPESLAALASCAAAAAALGISVRIVWDGAALRALVAGFDRSSLPGGRPPAGEILRETPGLPIDHFACSAASPAAGGNEAVLGKVRELVGWPTIAGWIERAERTLTF
jgi:predicted peroxiredoxin